MIQLNDTEKQQIEQAIQNLEKATSGEVVVYIAKQSHQYKKGIWIPVSLTAIVVLIAFYVLSHLWLIDSDFGVTEIVSTTLFTMFVVGALTYFLPKARLLFIDKDDVDEEVLQKAQGVFISEEIFSTKDRTGILIFISQLERKVIVLGDKGINEKITSNDWDNILSIVIGGLKNNTVTDSLCKAINACKTLLLSSGFNVAKNDTNELSNHVRIEE